MNNKINTKRKCGDCTKFNISAVSKQGYAMCRMGGIRHKDFPACSSLEERIHNDDINMFSKTDVRDGDDRD